MKSIDLWFRLSEVVPIAEHAVTSAEHSPSITQAYADEPGSPSLVWAKDDGTYLMSNGIPRQLADPDQPESPSIAAYSQGFGHGTGVALGNTPVGGDDFFEHIELTEPEYRGRTLIDLIRRYQPYGGWMILTATPTTYEISFTAAELL